MPAERMIQRLALFSEVAHEVRLGRTAFMKLCFFLQESRNVPLGYQFSIYSYGPFDSDVLTDLSTAVQMNVLKSTPVYYPSGYGYEYSLGSDESVRTLATEFLQANRESIRWATTNFGKKTAAELELLSTTLFVAKFNNPKDVAALVSQVQLIKPHFSLDQINRGFKELVSLNVLREAPVSG
jgi:hypothetical protein